MADPICDATIRDRGDTLTCQLVEGHYPQTQHYSTLAGRTGSVEWADEAETARLASSTPRTAVVADNDLRDQMAIALRKNLKHRTVPPIYGPCGHPITGGMGLTEFEIADTALAVVQPELDRLAAERDGVYRERAHLVAYLAAIHPSHIGYTDPDVPTWPVLTVETPTGQMCWHINPTDLDLFDHVTQVDPIAIGWDGHTTEEKYERLRELTAMPPRPDDDEWVDCTARRCQNGERFRFAEQRGWTRGGWGTWRCPSHRIERATEQPRAGSEATQTVPWPFPELRRATWMGRPLPTMAETAQQVINDLAERGIRLVVPGYDTPPAAAWPYGVPPGDWVTVFEGEPL